jgi:hypothetical protein
MDSRRARWFGLIAVGLAIAIGITFFSPFASGSPDGLERVAEDEGFLEEAEGPSYNVIADYAFPGIADERLATALAGVVGVLIVGGVGLVIGYGPRILRRRSGSGGGTAATNAGTGQGA